MADLIHNAEDRSNDTQVPFQLEIARSLGQSTQRPVWRLNQHHGALLGAENEKLLIVLQVWIGVRNLLVEKVSKTGLRVEIAGDVQSLVQILWPPDLKSFMWKVRMRPEELPECVAL